MACRANVSHLISYGVSQREQEHTCAKYGLAWTVRVGEIQLRFTYELDDVLFVLFWSKKTRDEEKKKTKKTKKEKRKKRHAAFGCVSAYVRRKS